MSSCTILMTEDLAQQGFGIRPTRGQFKEAVAENGGNITVHMADPQPINGLLVCDPEIRLGCAMFLHITSVDTDDTARNKLGSINNLELASKANVRSVRTCGQRVSDHFNELSPLSSCLPSQSLYAVEPISQPIHLANTP